MHLPRVAERAATTSIDSSCTPGLVTNEQRGPFGCKKCNGENLLAEKALQAFPPRLLAQLSNTKKPQNLLSAAVVLQLYQSLAPCILLRQTCASLGVKSKLKWVPAIKTFREGGGQKPPIRQFDKKSN